MTYTFQDILDNEDILPIIIRYLPFVSKIIVSKSFGKSYLKFYDFNSDDYKLKELGDLFDIMHDNDVIENIFDYKYYLDYDTILQKYIEVHKREFIENNLDYFSDDDEDESDLIEKIHSLSHTEFLSKIQYDHNIWHTRFQNEFDEKLDEFMMYSIFDLNIRILIQIIEDNDFDVIYDKSLDIFSLDDKIQNMWSNEIEQHYINNIDNLDKFCRKCGEFGHNNLSKECILHNEEYVAKEIKRV